MRLVPITDAPTLLVRALRQSARAAGCEADIVATAEEPWSSATFTGTRHRIVLADADAPAVAGWLATLPDAELSLRGHVVVDVAIDPPSTLRILTIEDA